MDYFKVLPTEERFQKLTVQQVLLLAEMKQNEIRKLEKQTRAGREEFFNPAYEAWEKEELERLSRQSKPSSSSGRWVEL